MFECQECPGEIDLDDAISLFKWGLEDVTYGMIASIGEDSIEFASLWYGRLECVDDLLLVSDVAWSEEDFVRFDSESMCLIDDFGGFGLISPCEADLRSLFESF